MLERAGIKRPPDLLVAATGDDEDNIVICQLARERYGVAKVIARINDPRNQPYFDLLGISPTVSATGAIMALIEHEVPEHGLIHLLELRKENLEIVEVTVDKGAACEGKRVRALRLPEGARLISVVRDGKAEIAGRARRSSRPATRCSRSSSRARRTSSGASSCATEPLGYRPPQARYRVLLVRRPATPTLLAWFATFAGLISIVSGPDAGAGRPHATSSTACCRPACRRPPARSRSRSGSATIWLSRGLARRKHRAWMLAVVVVFASAVAHLAKGLDVEEATVHLAAAGRAAARAPAVRRAGRPGDRAAAGAGRCSRSPCSCRSSSLHLSGDRRVVGARSTTRW